MCLDAKQNKDGREKKNDERPKSNFRTIVDFICKPAAKRTDSCTDERPEKCSIGEGYFWELFVYQHSKGC